jgi:uncharacterized repeat protein (TIGR03803 family)
MQKLLSTLSFILISFFAQAQLQFWGTASSGGDYGNGFIFKTDSIGDNLVIVHHFKKEIDGENIGALLLASNNKLYGLTGAGGQGGGANVFQGGTLFEYDLETDRFRVVEHLGPLSTNLPNVAMPKAEGQRGLTEVSPGLIYGLAQQGNYIFSYNFNTNVFARPFVLPTYQGGATNSTLQNRISEAFIKASDGNFYATTFTNSSCPIPNPNMGTILRLVPSTNTLTIRHKASCQAENGYSYNGHLSELNGKLYSTTSYGGTSNQGVIYEYTPASNTFVKRHDFHGGVLSNSYAPTSIVIAKNGKLYGTSHGGGVPETNLPGGGGTLFEFDPQSNLFTTKYNFLLGVSWLGDVGIFPSSLISGMNGKLYGVTEFGVFEYNTTTDNLRMAGRFWNRGFAPSIVQLCRKPSYEFQEVTTHEACSGKPFTFDLGSPNATSVLWKHNDIADASQTTSALSFESFSASDAGTWTCTLTNECGSTTSQTITLNINEPVEPTITTSGSTNFCKGETVTLSAPEGFENYIWSSGETSREITVSEQGEYSVRVSNGCESPSSVPVAIIVNELPSAPTAIESVSYNKLKAIGTGTSYEWTLNGSILDESSDVITVTESGEYQVRAMNEQGCVSAEFASLSFIVTALESENEKIISVYPNPADDIININVPEIFLGHVDVIFFSLKGELVRSKSMQFDRRTKSIYIGDLPTGFYHILVKKRSNIISMQVVIR